MSTQQTSQDNPLADFGPNEWIVEDMYQRYVADPTSVDAAWHEFFADYRPATDTAPPAPPASPATAPPAAAPVTVPAAPTGTTPSNGGPVAAPPRPKDAPPATPAKEVAARALPTGAKTTVLRGIAARIVANMDESLTVPTATSVRAVPAKLLSDNRIVINNHLLRGRGGKVSFTHLIGYALVKALALHPEMNNSYAHADGKPVLVEP
ncbi:MAG: multifunctional oxoglutarate decarboxylase/oxoglutarate dehydrogenase thiamine pyrophosphate-binding subunit/dihydrolipoyllysine-residue succinyltransferase subunit, partial [Actinobacteria bacterium]